MSLLFRFYVQHFGTYDQTYGSLGGIVVLLLWIQLTALILLVAAQINQVICSCTSDTPAQDGCPPRPADDNSNSNQDSSTQARYLHYGQGKAEQPLQQSLTPELEKLSMSVDPHTGHSHRSDETTAADVMNDEFRTCGRFSTVMEAVLIFREADCGMVPVTEEGKPVGVVTDRDVALALAHDGTITTQPISEIMSDDIASVAPYASLSQVVQEFRREGVRRLLVVNDAGVLVGVISWADVVENLPNIVTGQMVNDIVNQP